ncbi:MAG: BrnT family toxin [FCB group bacterium]|nr:BrnT family toxin [FCB group bacterium]
MAFASRTPRGSSLTRGLTREDPAARSEQRFVSVGADAVGRILVVCYTYRDDAVRVISARHATRKERCLYEKGI